MKKAILFVCVTLSFAAISSAQSFHIGAKAGANLTKIDGQSFKQGYELGYQLGGFLELDLNKNWGIQPEVLFSQTNTIVDSGFKFYNPSTIIGSKAHLNYLSIPILLRLNAGNLLTINLGPQFSILTNEDKTLLSNGKAAIKHGDLAGVLGAQINLGSLRVYGRYNFGLNNINDLDDQNKWKSKQLQFGLGLKLL